MESRSPLRARRKNGKVDFALHPVPGIFPYIHPDVQFEVMAAVAVCQEQGLGVFRFAHHGAFPCHPEKDLLETPNTKLVSEEHRPKKWAPRRLQWQGAGDEHIAEIDPISIDCS
jgi:hypothetical protein